MFASTRTIIAIIFATLVLATGVGGFWYISGLRASLAVSEENAKKLTQAIEQQGQVIAQMQRDQQEIKTLNATLRSEVRNREKDLSSLRDRFDRDIAGRHRDFGKIAAEKPASIEAAINRGTINAARCMAIASGAPLTEAEKNATKPDEINKECPSLANPKYVPPGN